MFGYVRPIPELLEEGERSFFPPITAVYAGRWAAGAG